MNIIRQYRSGILVISTAGVLALLLMPVMLHAAGVGVGAQTDLSASAASGIMLGKDKHEGAAGSDASVGADLSASGSAALSSEEDARFTLGGDGETGIGASIRSFLQEKLSFSLGANGSAEADAHASVNAQSNSDASASTSGEVVVETGAKSCLRAIGHLIAPWWVKASADISLSSECGLAQLPFGIGAKLFSSASATADIDNAVDAHADLDTQTDVEIE